MFRASLVSPSREVESAWKHVKDMLVELIDETRTADESMRTYITDDGESGDWFVTASSASSRPLNKSSSDIADEEIALGGCAYKNCRHTRTL